MMKRICVLIALFGLIASAGFAQPGKAARDKHPAAFPFKPQAEFSVMGRVVSITAADPARGVKPVLTLAAENGTQMSFLIGATTTIYDAELRAIHPAEIRSSARIKVRYRTDRDGFNQALSISELAP